MKKNKENIKKILLRKNYKNDIIIIKKILNISTLLTRVLM